MNLITFTHQIAMSLHRVGLAGAAVNLRAFHKVGKEWQRMARMLQDLLVKRALKTGMSKFTPTNDNHVREFLYERLEFPILEKTIKSGLPSVAKPTLKRLLVEHKDSVAIRNLLKYNHYDKLGSTWYGNRNANKPAHRKSVADLIVPISKSRDSICRSNVGLLHFWIFPLRARTGRRTSGGSGEGDPESRNSQNWPPEARKVIVSRWKQSKIAICDFSRLEVVLIAWRAKDEKLLHYFTEGDGYIGVAKEFWGQDVAKDTPLYTATKNMVLGINYNMNWWKLAHDLWHRADFKFSTDWEEHVKKTKAARKRYLGIFKGLQRYIRHRITEVTDTQQIISPSGRIRHLPHHGPLSEGFWHIKNSAVNFPIQSFAGDVTGGALVDYEEALLQEHGLSFRDWHLALLDNPHNPPASPIFNEVHDELDLDLHPVSGKKDLEILRASMEDGKTLKKLVPGFDLKLKVDIKVRRAWE